MFPTGYRPIRITRTEPRITRGDALALIIGFVLLANLAEWFLFIR